VIARGGFSRVGAALVGATVLGLAGCRDQQAGPTTQDFARERAALAAKLDEKQAKQAKQAETAKARPVVAKVAADATGPSFGSVDLSFSYDPRGKRDPFRSSQWDQLAKKDEEIRGPLEQFDVGQLSLVAVVWHTGNARALVQDPAGQSYIVREGTRIGKNAGRVLTIGDSSVVVKETYVDFLGQETTKDIEMRIRRSQGG
jgi:type IV pilus assembly protein PilP